YMKKNRPGHVVTVIAKKDDAEDLAQVLIAETGTLGVREVPVNRHISPRTSRTIQLRIGGKTHQVGVKIAEDRQGRVVGFKVEYEDLRRIADQSGISDLKLQRLATPLLESLEKGDRELKSLSYNTVNERLTLTTTLAAVYVVVRAIP